MPVVLILQSVEGITNASKEDLVLCPGLGPQKVSRNFEKFQKGMNIQQKGRWTIFLTDRVKNVFVYRRGVSMMFCINPSSNPKTLDLLTEDHAALEKMIVIMLNGLIYFSWKEIKYYKTIGL